MHVDLQVETELSKTARAQQLCGMFDVPERMNEKLHWTGEVPLEARDWNVGLIVGPSGSGKSQLARKLFGPAVDAPLSWGAASVIDDFASRLSMDEITAACQAVGFNTIPAWLRPFRVLSNGEQFRASIARRLLELEPPIVVDEFTSVIDRQVAKIASHAVQRLVRRKKTRFVAVSCHSDIIEWLQPDWMLEPATMRFTWRCLQRRPALGIEIARVQRDVWKLFAPYHYLTAELHQSARCYALFVEGGAPAAFAATLYRPHPKVRDIYGVPRLVTQPDFQGIGLAFVIVEALGAAYKALGFRLHTYPAHPALVRQFDRSRVWALEKRPGFSSTSVGKRTGKNTRFGGRPNAVFEYVGNAMSSREDANRLIEGN